MCYCDRYWAPVEQCRIPGALALNLPFVCPLDHVLVPGHFGDATSGPRLDFREHSFLENPRTPAILDQAALHVRLDAQPKAAPGLTEEGGLRTLALPRHQDDVELKHALSAYQVS